MKRLHEGQRGFTILELLLVIILTGIITAAITTTVFQVFNMNTRTANHMIAVSQVQQAGKLVSEDILQAQNLDTESEFLKLTWTEGGVDGDSHEVIYSLVDMPSGEFKRLQREHYVDSALNSTTVVAEHINPDPTKTSCDLDGSVLTFIVTATVGDESEQRTYKVQPRPGT